MKKSTKKTVKTPEILIDCVNYTCSNDLYSNYIVAKVRAGKTITEEQLDGYAMDAVRKAADIIIPAAIMTTSVAWCDYCKGNKKQSWYKRLWKKIKGIFTRK